MSVQEGCVEDDNFPFYPLIPFPHAQSSQTYWRTAM